MLDLPPLLLSYISSYQVKIATTALNIPINPHAPRVGAPNTVAVFSCVDVPPVVFAAVALPVAEAGG